MPFEINCGGFGAEHSDNLQESGLCVGGLWAGGAREISIKLNERKKEGVDGRISGNRTVSALSGSPYADLGDSRHEDKKNKDEYTPERS